MTTQYFLAEADKNYNSKIYLVGTEFIGNGYHSLIPNGTWVHPTRDSIYYALHLLKTGEVERQQRALDIINKIISLQNTNLYSPTYGIWSWLFEEPVEKMSPPDWNWADFIGAALAHGLKDFGEILPEKVFQNVALSLGHAAWSIFRRNVRPDYTNIAIMGAAVTAVAGEVLNETRLVEYARERITTIVKYTQAQGGLNEYNSPCYTFVALEETERILQLVEDQEIKKYAEELRKFIWKNIAQHYHPYTKQLAGPHSRTYSNLLSEHGAHYIDWAVSGKNSSEYKPLQLVDFVKHMSCPQEYRQSFSRLPTKEIEQKNRFIKKSSNAESFYGTTWMNKEVALGSINHECFWTQRRPLLGYWLDDEKQTVVLRLRLLKDGKDFSSGGLYNAQVKNKILTGIKIYTDRGDHHLFLDRPDNGIFKFKSLVLRYELLGKNVKVNNLGSDQYELSAGSWKAAITAPAGIFNAKHIKWQIGQEQGKAYIEAVLYEGKEQDFLFDDSIFIKLVLGTELLRKNETSVKKLLFVKEMNGRMQVSWQNIILKYNPYGESYE